MVRYFVLFCLGVLTLRSFVWAQDLDKRIKDDEAKRLATVSKVQPAVVAVFAKGGGGGGSGVLIDKDGFALTNFHVVQPCGPTMQCGLADGVLYDAVLVGLDPVGDVALIKLLPKQEGKPFPFAALGDSDKVRVGDWALAMGNPFLLATDFTPTITFGIISGTHRYQQPAGLILEYTDCLQTEASINPGNSGGPLFNLDGDVIGINGRGSFEKRGRVNSGAGYAISSNQIKNFLGQLRGGLVADHATLGAKIETDEEGKMIVTRILESSDAYRRGLREDDEIIAFAGQPIRSVNQYKNVLGIYPKGWRLPLLYRHNEEKKESQQRETLVRLMGVLPSDVLKEPLKEKRQPQLPPMPPDQPKRPGRPAPRPGQPEQPEPKKPDEESPAAKFYEAKPGFANYYFNKLEQERLLAGLRKHGDFVEATGVWRFDAEVERPVKNALQGEVDDKFAKLRLGEKDNVKEFAVEPLKPGESAQALSEPPGSGGLVAALYQWRRFLVMGEKGFEAGFAYAGREPYYRDGTIANRADADVLQTEHGAALAKWYFSTDDQTLIGLECYIDRENQDPCEITFSEYKDVGGRKLPHRLEVRFGDKEYAVIKFKSYNLEGK